MADELEPLYPVEKSAFRYNNGIPLIRSVRCNCSMHVMARRYGFGRCGYSAIAASMSRRAKS